MTLRFVHLTRTRHNVQQVYGAKCHDNPRRVPMIHHIATAVALAIIVLLFIGMFTGGMMWIADHDKEV